MYFKTLVTKWEGVGRCSRIPPHAVGQEYVFNVNHISQLKAFGTGSEFLYAEWPYDRKTGYSKIQCNATVQDIKNEYEILPSSNIISLDIFPNKNVNNVPETIRINVNDISYAWAHNPYLDYSWLRYCLKGGRDRIVLVDKSLTELIAHDAQFDENNVQWWAFVDPAETIEPTYYIIVA